MTVAEIEREVGHDRKGILGGFGKQFLAIYVALQGRGVATTGSAVKAIQRNLPEDKISQGVGEAIKIGAPS